MTMLHMGGPLPPFPPATPDRPGVDPDEPVPVEEPPMPVPIPRPEPPPIPERLQ
jgi:hypothetical protein